MMGRVAAKRQTHASPAAVRDPLYLFACHLEWRKHGNVRGFEELLAALDDPNEQGRLVAEALLGRLSPRRLARQFR